MKPVLPDINMCTGCGACYNICPTKAIRVSHDTNGFLRANIEKEDCIHCGLCEKICPVLHPKYNNRKDPECYAVWASEHVRSKSSSGGAFTPIAEYVLAEGGVVFGAAWTKDFYVEHLGIQTIQDIDLLNRSKYVQSNTGDTFKEAKEFLDKNIKVLYSGCPCQIAGLKNYLQKDYDNLITVDLLCSHVPPITIFRQYLEENYGIENIKSFSFRDKSHGWNGDYQRIELKSGEVIVSSAQDDYWQKAYHPKLLENVTCMECNFAKLPRQADITLGDFWRIGNFDSSWDDRKGTSLVLVNSSQGERILKKIQNQYQRIEIRPKEWTRPNRIQGRNPIHASHDRFVELIKYKPFNTAVDYALNHKYDVGLVGVWLVKNYGNNLTYYALYKVLEDMGLSTLLIERAMDAPVKPFGDRPPLLKSNPLPAYAMSKVYPNKIAMKALNAQCEYFIVGSDQLLSNYLYKRFGGHINLSWVHDYKKKIAYAVSIGHNSSKGAKVDRETKAYFFRKFDSFSMREESGCEIIKEQYDVDAVPVLDPVFICNQKHFDDLVLHADIKLPASFIGGYILDPGHEKENFVNYLADKLNLPYSIVSDAEYTQQSIKDKWNLHTLTDLGCEDWLYIVKNCDFFITDSFHGMCFAIIYQKPFIVIDNEKRGSTRFLSILRKLNLEDRIVDNLDYLKTHDHLLKPIDYSSVSAIIEQEKEKSLNWLKDAVFTPIKPFKIKSTFDILDSRCDNLSRKYFELLQDYKKLDARIKQLETVETSPTPVAEQAPVSSPNIIKRGVKCLKAHGIIYTLKYGMKKLLDLKE